MSRPSTSLLVALALLEACASRPSGRCGSCADGLECHAVERTGFLFSSTFAEYMCTRPCAFDHECSALAPGAYCSFAELCLIACTMAEECSSGAPCIGGICGVASGDAVQARPYLGEVGLRIALGAQVSWWLEDVPCTDVSLRSEPPGIIDVGFHEWVDRSRPDCWLLVQASARHPGRADVVVTRADAELARRAFQVERAASLTIGRTTLFTLPVDPMDLAQLDEPGLLTVMARGADGERLGVGLGARWSVDPPSVASVNPWLDSDWSEVGLATILPTEGGRGTLSVDVGGVTHSIPIEL